MVARVAALLWWRTLALGSLVLGVLGAFALLAASGAPLALKLLVPALLAAVAAWLWHRLET